MQHSIAGEVPVFARGIDQDQLCLVPDAFLDYPRRRPTLAASRCAEDRTMPSEETLRLHGNKAVLGHIDSAEIQDDGFAVILGAVHQAR